jgi:hypothetical protein
MNHRRAEESATARFRGGLLDVDETCRECGNPVWIIRWMTQAD